MSTPTRIIEMQPQPLCQGLVCEPGVLRDISMQAVDGLFKLRHGGLEVGGVLYGYREPGRVRIAASRPFEPAYAYGPAYRLSEQDIERLRELIGAYRRDPDLADMEPAGWYVSHTRSDMKLTEDNARVFADCFPEASAVTLVLKPAKFDPSRAVLYRRDHRKSVVESAAFDIDHRMVPPADDDPPPPQKMVRPLLETRETAVVAAPVIVADASPRSWLRPHPAVPALACALAIVAIALPAAFRHPEKSVRQASREAAVGPPIVIQPDADWQQADRSATRHGANQPDSRVQALEREVADLRSRLQSGGRALPEPQPRTFVPPPSRPSARSAAAQTASSLLVSAPTADLSNGALPLQPAPSALSLGTTIAAPPPSRAPAAGRLIWTGSLRKGELLFIDGARPSSGALSGTLPGGPVSFKLRTGELSAGGMLIYTADRALAGKSESPHQSNGWNHTIYEYDPKRLRDVAVMESPRSENGWKKMVLRDLNRPVGVIILDWEASGEATPSQ